MGELIPQEIVEQKIFVIRGHKVMLDKDLAVLYGVETRNLNKAVTRNLERFPEDFMFQLTAEKVKNLMFQNGTSSWGGTRKMPRSSGDIILKFQGQIASPLDRLGARNDRRMTKIGIYEDASRADGKILGVIPLTLVLSLKGRGDENRY